MKVTSLDLPGVLLIEPRVFPDQRGFFIETYQAKQYRDMGIDLPFVQDNHSRSVKGTLRGLHYQLRHPQGKLVRVLHGIVFDVAADVRRGSPTFGKWVGTILSDENRRQLYVPPGYAHGFCVLSDTVDFLYKCTDYYTPGDEFGVVWNDPTINVDWPLRDALLSDKDAALPLLRDAGETLPLYTVPATKEQAA